MKKNILVATAFGISIAFLQACNDSTTSSETTSDTATHNESTAGTHTNMGETNSEHDQMMKKMMDDMNAVKMSGDFDHDFASMMIPHHQNAVDMAENYLPKGKDEKIKGMAQQIISSQKKEIEELRTMVSNHKPVQNKQGQADPGHAGGEHNELMEAMNTMMNKMKGMQMTGDADKDFVTMMIPHHQSAVDMAEHEISHGKQLETKKFAKKVIDDQTTEIKAFQDWLTSRK